jgi:hypothetical protein
LHKLGSIGCSDNNTLKRIIYTPTPNIYLSVGVLQASNWDTLHLSMGSHYTVLPELFVPIPQTTILSIITIPSHSLDTVIITSTRHPHNLLLASGMNSPFGQLGTTLPSSRIQMEGYILSLSYQMEPQREDEPPTRSIQFTRSAHSHHNHISK